MSDGAEVGSSIFVLLSCEHGGREVPDAYEPLFRGQGAILESHRGYDIGALGVALRMAARLSLPIIFSTVTRLLVDLNRSPNAAGVFSEFTTALPGDQRERLLADFCAPHRRSVAEVIRSAVAAQRRVIHLAIHSCTDELDGSTRHLDIALLFDEARTREEDFCRRYRTALERQAADLRYPFNEPYKGADDGLTTTMRSRFAPEDYLGIEIEVRQGLIRPTARQEVLGDLLATALATLLSPEAAAEESKEPS